MVEFAVIVPLMVLLVIAIADFGRFYNAAVAVETAGREAADFGAFETSYWEPSNVTVTVDEMRRRACIAAAGSHLEGYETTDPVNHTTCSNPSFQCTLELGGSTTPCDTSGGFVGATDCSSPATDPPCTVHVRMEYDFNTFLGVAPLPASVHITRDSRFRISSLTPP